MMMLQRCSLLRSAATASAKNSGTSLPTSTPSVVTSVGSYFARTSQRTLATTSTSTNVTPTKTWNVYLSGEIHSDWRDVIAKGILHHNLPVSLSSPNTSHEDSDDCGALILGMEQERHNWDKIGANMNRIRTQTLIQQADIVVVRFGDKYRQWNAAFDAGYAAALQKSIITLHPSSISHMLKEVNANASAVCEDPEQVVQTLAYVIHGTLPDQPRDGTANYMAIADRLGKGNPNP
jgi:YtoQ family protein